jgi:hypothetical protein
MQSRILPLLPRSLWRAARYGQRPSIVGDVVWTLLRRALFHGPLADDQFGDLHRLHEIDRNTLAVALTDTRRRLSTIFILWPNATDHEVALAADSVGRLLETHRNARHDRISMPEDSHSVANPFISETSADIIHQEFVGIGLKLPSLVESFPASAELAQMFLLLRGFLGKKLVHITRDTTVFKDMWQTKYDGYFSTKAEELSVVGRLKADINKEFGKIKDHMNTGWIKSGGYFQKMLIKNQTKVFDLSIDADVFGLCLDDVLGSACSITPKQVDILADWVQSCTATSVVYYGPRGREINIVHHL